MPLAVDIQVQEGIVVAVHIAHLAGQIENDNPSRAPPAASAQVPNIPLDKLDLVENAPEIEQVAAIQGQHGVQDRYPGPLGHRQMGDGAADHAGAAGNQHPGAAECYLTRK